MANAGSQRSLERSADLLELLILALPGARRDSHEWLADNARVRRVSPDELVFRQGEAFPIGLIIDGIGAFRRTTPDGRQLVIGLATRGLMFGFSGVSVPHSRADLLALTPGHIAVWPAEHLRPLVDRDPRLALAVIERMGQFIAGLTERLDGFLYQDARRRVLRILAQYESIFFGDAAVLSRSHLPSLVGTSREMTSRVLRELERDGIIRRTGRSGLELLSPQRLDEADSRGSDEGP